MPKGRIQGGWWGQQIPRRSSRALTGPSTVTRSGVGVTMDPSGQMNWAREQLVMRDFTYTRGAGTALNTTEAVVRSGILTSEVSSIGPSTVARSGILTSEVTIGPPAVARPGVGYIVSPTGQMRYDKEQARMRDYNYTRGIGTYGA